MKEHVQDYGVRKWAGDDLIELQAEPLSALQALVAPYAPCILTGCELETVPDGNGDGSPAYRLHAGYVALKGPKTVDNGAGTDTDTGAEGTENGAGGTEDSADAGVAATAENGDTAAAQDEEYVKIVRVSAQTVKQPTVFLTLGCTPLSRAYGNGENKAIAYDYTAEVCDVLSKVGDRPYLTLVADAENPRLPDKLGITKKLDRVGGEAQDTVVKFTDDGGQDAPEDLQSGLTLGLLISRIKKWLGKKVDKESTLSLAQGGTGKTTASDAANVLLNGLSIGSATPADNATIAISGNGTNTYYRKPLSLLLKWIKSNLASVATSGKYSDLINRPTIPTVGNGTITIKQAGNVKGTFTTNQSGDTTIELTDNDNDTVYTHPSYAARTGMPTSNQTPSFGSTFDVTQPVSDGLGHITGLNTRTVKIPNDIASTSSAGLMSASDKSKLNGIGSDNIRITTYNGKLRLIWKNMYVLGSPDYYIDLTGSKY